MAKRNLKIIEKPDGYEFPKLSADSMAQKEQLLERPIHQVDLDTIDGLDDLMEAYSEASIQARNLGTCAKVFEQMLTDPDRPTIMLGLAGPLIAAGLRKVIRDMVEHKLVDVIVSTGAIIYQDVYQAKGFKHFRGTPTADDRTLRDLYIDRIYDTYVDEDKFWRLDCSIGHFADELPEGRYSTRQFLAALGEAIDDPHSILGTATRHGVPLFVPALNDSSIGIGLTDHYHRCLKEGREGIIIDSIRDNYELTQLVVKSPCTAAVYIAGGVPKNFINDSVVMSYVFGTDTGGHRYAIQLTTDSPHWGGLSGSTLSEATSWGKVSKKATHCMAFVEPSISLPLLIGSQLKKNVAANRKRLALKWDSPILSNIETK